MNQYQHPVFIPTARRLTPVPNSPPPGISWPWTAVAVYVGVASFALAAMLALGCASADGSAHPPEQVPSPEAHQEPSEVCSSAPGFVAWESDGLVHVSKRAESTAGGAHTMAVTQHYDRTPPFFDVFGDAPMFVGSDLSVCLL